MLPSRIRQAYALLISLGLCVVVAQPVRRHLGDAQVRDSFPLSTFPMFSKARPALEPATYLIALEGDGTRHFVRYTHWASGGWNQGRAQVHRYKKGRAGGPEALCELVAGSLSEVPSGWPTQAVEVQMVWGEYDVERWFVEDYQLPAAETTLARCEVPR